MGLFSFFRKNKQESASPEGEFYSRAEEASGATRSRGKRGSGAKGNSNKHAGDPLDPVLPEKKRARRRLVGAIALVLTVIVVLPMILDSVPKPVSGDIEIQIPSKDKPFHGREPLAQSNAVPSAPVASASNASETPASVSEKPVESTTTSTIVTVTTSTLKGLKDGAAGSPSSDSDKALKLAAKDPSGDKKAEVQKAAAPVVTADKSTEAARATALLEGKAAAPGDAKAVEAKPDADKKSTKFSVQVAALATQEKVSELQAKLRAAGIKSFTQKVATQSGERIRVRVGPFANKVEAERMRAKLVKMGLNGSLVPA